MTKIKSHYSDVLGCKQLYRWAMSKKLPTDNFKWKKETPMFDENFIKRSRPK